MHGLCYCCGEAFTHSCTWSHRSGTQLHSRATTCHLCPSLTERRWTQCCVQFAVWLLCGHLVWAHKWTLLNLPGFFKCKTEGMLLVNRHVIRTETKEEKIMEWQQVGPRGGLFNSSINLEGPRANSVTCTRHSGAMDKRGWVLQVWNGSCARLFTIAPLVIEKTGKRPNCMAKLGVSGRLKITFAFWKDHVGGRLEGWPRRVHQMRRNGGRAREGWGGLQDV